MPNLDGARGKDAIPPTGKMTAPANSSAFFIVISITSEVIKNLPAIIRQEEG
jgi:hypothetical protein